MPSMGLETLERELLGPAAAPVPDAYLPLKARLERLVAAATQRERRGPVPLEELVAGMRIENVRGEFFLVESSVHLAAHVPARSSRTRSGC
jgi:hypothetical protein